MFLIHHRIRMIAGFPSASTPMAPVCRPVFVVVGCVTAVFLFAWTAPDFSCLDVRVSDPHAAADDRRRAQHVAVNFSRAARVDPQQGLSGPWDAGNRPFARPFTYGPVHAFQEPAAQDTGFEADLLRPHPPDDLSSRRLAGRATRCSNGPAVTGPRAETTETRRPAS